MILMGERDNQSETTRWQWKLRFPVWLSLTPEGGKWDPRLLLGRSRRPGLSRYHPGCEEQKALVTVPHVPFTLQHMGGGFITTG